MSELTTEQAAYLRGLLDLADFLTEYPEFIKDEHDGTYGMQFFLDPEAMVTRAREIGGDWQQAVEHGYVKLTHRFGPHYVYLYTKASLVGKRITEMKVSTSWRVRDLLAEPAPSEPPVTPEEDEAFAQRGWRESKI